VAISKSLARTATYHQNGDLPPDNDTYYEDLEVPANKPRSDDRSRSRKRVRDGHEDEQFRKRSNYQAAGLAYPGPVEDAGLVNTHDPGTTLVSDRTEKLGYAGSGISSHTNQPGIQNSELNEEETIVGLDREHEQSPNKCAVHIEEELRVTIQRNPQSKAPANGAPTFIHGVAFQVRSPRIGKPIRAQHCALRIISGANA
jgi:hypothetical protein